MPARRGHFAGEAGTTAEDSRLWRSGRRRPRVASRDHQEDIFLPKLSATETARDEQLLLVVAENLLGGKSVRGGPELA